MTEMIRAALARLECSNDNHWTADGLPRLDVVSDFAGVKGLKRNEVTEAAPTFTRENPVLEPVALEPEPTPFQPSDEEALGEVLATVSAALNTPLSDLEETLTAAEAKLAEAEKAFAEAKKVMLKAQLERDKVIEARDRNRPVHENQEAIMAYLERQKIIRLERAERTQQIREAGIDPKMFQTKAPLDVSMARKTGYGHQRPQPRPVAKAN